MEAEVGGMLELGSLFFQMKTECVSQDDLIAL